jgi:hypothetical protein
LNTPEVSNRIDGSTVPCTIRFSISAGVDGSVYETQRRSGADNGPKLRKTSVRKSSNPSLGRNCRIKALSENEPIGTRQACYCFCDDNLKLQGRPSQLKRITTLRLYCDALRGEVLQHAPQRIAVCGLRTCLGICLCRC